MKKAILISLFAIAFLAMAGIYASLQYIPKFLIKTVQKNCESCELKIGAASIGLSEGLCFKNIIFKVGDPKVSLVEGEIQKLCADLDLGEYINNSYKISHLNIVRPRIKMSETELASQVKNQGEPGIPEFLIENVSLAEGRFSYIDKTENNKGVVTIEDIKINIDRISSYAKDKNTYSTGHGFGIIKNGQIELILKTKIFKEPYESILIAKVKNHNLKALNDYFEPVYGIRLQGNILKGDSLLKQKGKELKSQTRFAFKGIDVDLKKTQDRGRLLAFFMELGIDIALCEQNLDKGNREKYQTAEYRHKDGSIVSFFLMGMLQSALKVVCLKPPNP